VVVCGGVVVGCLDWVRGGLLSVWGGGGGVVGLVGLVVLGGGFLVGVGGGFRTVYTKDGEGIKPFKKPERY